MKKNGFTLVELLSIVVILGIIVVVALPQISGSIGSKKEKQYNKIVKIVENAGKVYLTENGTMDSVSIDKLIESDYLTSGLKNPINNTPLTGCVKKITSDGVTKYKYEVDNCPNYLTTYIMDLYDNEETRTSNGLKKDNTPDQNIRYYGSNPNNYVSFNNELWRIIGVFGNNVKLIRNEKLGNLSWDSSESSINRGYGVNEWSQADLKNYLNTMYYEGTSVTCYNEKNNQTTTCPANKLDETSKSLIDNHTWNIGAIDKTDTTIVNPETFAINTVSFYKAERGTTNGKICNGRDACNDTVTRTTEWTGYIGLPYPTDYAYASSESDCETNMNAGDIDFDNGIFNMTCKKNNWMHHGTTMEIEDATWFMSPVADPDFAANVWYVLGGGLTNDSCAAYPFSAFPTIYLKSNIIIESGKGTSSDPYELSL
jgi:type II secretory pathway pseudopilin PulG